MTDSRELLARLLNVPSAFVSDLAAARFEDWLHAHDVEVRQDELQRAIEARPEPETTWQRLRFKIAESRGGFVWRREQVEEWLELRRAYVPERESRKPCPLPD